MDPDFFFFLGGGGGEGGIWGGRGDTISFIFLDTYAWTHAYLKYQEYQAYPKVFEIEQPPKYSESVHWPNQKALKCIEMTQQNSPIL